MYGSANTATSGNYIAPPQVAPRTPSQITQRLSELDASTQQLHDVLTDLESRIITVLRPMPPGTATGSGDKPEGPTAPLALGIRELTDRVRGAISRVRELNDRIEL